MEDIYPAGPVSVPDYLTRPTWAYKRRAWLALAGLGTFMALYLGLTAWFVWTAYRLFAGMAEGNGNFAGFMVASGAAFFAVFMLKALFFFRRGQEASANLEVTAAEQPRLFEFLHRLADEVRAPRPHRVFLSPSVNAAVFYDLSLFNLLWPSKKNLEIGLGLINVLTLGEIKAVLAHEFGHFAQRSMAVGRWVYVAQQIAAQIISRRDALDRFLAQLSRIDLRVAWIGWIMQMVVWSIRSVMETMFHGVVLAQRALSREMELQADLVAVSLTGSDALVSALHRLHAADDAWARTLNFARGEFERGRPVADLFAVQTQIIGRLREILAQPDYGRVPPVPAEGKATYRLFKAGLAQPPRMWATHPANSEREENAKRTYIHAAGDDREAWVLFGDAATLRRTMSLHLSREAKNEPAPVEDSLARLDQDFNRLHLDRRYRGVFLGRSPVRHAASVDKLYGTTPDPAGLASELAALYPDSLAQTLERLRGLNEELQALQALRDRSAQAVDGNIRHRGATLKRRQLPQVIARVEAEIQAERQIIESHDARCRSAHFAAAASLGTEWQEYLRGLAAVLHYADHAEADLRDVQGCLANVFAIVTARGNVGSRGLKRLLAAADEVHEALIEVYGKQHQVKLDAQLAGKLGVADWPAVLGELKLPGPTRSNIKDWLGVIDSWVNSATGNLSKLRLAALELLLSTEARIADAMGDGQSPGDAPTPPSQTPTAYRVLVPGKERLRQKQLNWWDRFQLARGFFPAAARLAVALAIVGGVLGFSGGLGKTGITIYNGLERPVRVTVGNASAQVAALGHTEIQLSPSPHYAVSTKTLEGTVIESFDADAHLSFANYVYNVAGATPLVQWTAVYGNVGTVPERRLGAPRWSSTVADFIFEEPPREISSKTGGGSRTVLGAFADQSPPQQLELIGNDGKAAQALIASHARWDGSNSPYAIEWLGLAAQGEHFGELLATRLQEAPNDVLLRRVAQDSSEASHEACARDEAQARAQPENGDLQYLAARCLPDVAGRDRAFDAAYHQWPDNPWLMQAAGFGAAEHGRWPEALHLLDQARKHLPALGGYIALDLYRIHRLLGSDTPQLAAELGRSSNPLRTMLALETGEGISSGTARAYHELAQGKLDAALLKADPEAAASARMERLVGASDGASDSQVERALALPPDQGIDSQSAWSALGLALRRHHDPAPFIQAVQQGNRRRDTVDRAVLFVQSARPGMSADTIESMLAGLDPELRGQAYSGAVVALGKAAPQEWRDAARKLLFASERPSFR